MAVGPELRRPTVVLAWGAAFSLTLLAGLVAFVLVESSVWIESLQRTRELERLRGTVLTYDEVLTSSTRLAVATGEPRWRERYLEAEPALDSALARIQQITEDEEVRRAAAETVSANRRLIELEREAFTRLDEGDRTGAYDLVFSDAYEEVKEAYSDGTIQLAESITAAVERTRQTRQRRSTQLGFTVALLGIGMIGVGWVVSGRLQENGKAVETVYRQARWEEDRFRAVVDGARDAIISMDSSSRIVYWNRGASRIFGIPAKTAIGRHATEFLVTDDAKRLSHRARSLERPEETVWRRSRESWTGRRADGSSVPLEATFSMGRTEDGLILTAIAHDLSDRVRLESRILEVAREERQRIGGELHDGIGQLLVGVGMRLRAISGTLRRGGHPQADATQELLDQVQRAVGWVRSALRAVTPLGPEGRNLRDALEWLSRDLDTLFGVPVEIRLQPEVDELPREMAESLFAIAREAATNAAKHSGASRVEITYRCEAGACTLVVEDDGQGFNLEMIEEQRGPRESFGLELMRYRARVVGADLTIDSEPDRGTRVCCSIASDACGLREPELTLNS